MKESEKIIDSAQDIIREMNNIKKSNNQSTSEVKKMTDSELRNAINRLNMEKQYSELSSRYINTGLSHVSFILEIMGSITAIAASSAAIASTVYNLKNKELKFYEHQ